MIDSFLVEFMIIGLFGIGSQWIAWRYRLPAIVVMSIVGLLSGPILGLINPEQDFGELYRPFISIAVAIILFEGSLNLNVKEIKGIGKPVFRIVTWGAFLSWLLGSFAAHYVANLSWAVSLVISAIFIVTGPTVILPLLRQSKLKPRPAKILKWEGIIVDPFGALLAVFAFEIIVFLTGETSTIHSLLYFIFASIVAVLLGWIFGKLIGFSFEVGRVPEYLKSSAVLIAVIACFTIADEIAHETGLLAVTSMGMVLANMGIGSIRQMRHFKEDISILLVSAIFIMLTASLTKETLMQVFSIEIIGYVLLMLFLVRPLVIFLSTIGTGLKIQEKILIGWIAPRGIVALTVASYFASVLAQNDYAGAELVTSVTFALVFFTVCAHGFSIGWLAKKLGLSSEGKPGVLIAGSNGFSVSLAKTLQQLDIPVLITDASWQRLYKVRQAGIPFHYGEILSEQTEYSIDMTPYDYLIAATEYDAYNALVSSTFVPEFGRKDVYRLPIQRNSGDQLEDVDHTIGGRVLFSDDIGFDDLTRKIDLGYTFRKTTLTTKYTFDDFLANCEPETVRILTMKAETGALKFFTDDASIKPVNGDTIISLTPPSKEFNKIKERIIEQREQ
ncbi:K(+)/H(+) antiporter NhaP2 [Paraliobacillus ryukyuensis]|uniref:Sodium/proton antiporter (CPA1 family) n=1 Tax=Paraliobacillus ryukyuensis TaxID=200904 RepID=A0A366EEM9_9BACI|nr:sodium:proton antiporter [Paraliobacillus ryukyuensis]RBP00486.1 sodium/proton antiporter (CPA1 family) [Paraliobacillus ryukyuensis]